MRELPLDDRLRTFSCPSLLLLLATAAVTGRFGSKYRDFTSCSVEGFLISVSTEAVDLSLVMCCVAAGAERRCTADVDALRSGLIGAFGFFVLIAVEIRSGTCDFDDDFVSTFPEKSIRIH